jgi:hypothetical protein
LGSISQISGGFGRQPKENSLETEKTSLQIGLFTLSVSCVSKIGEKWMKKGWRRNEGWGRPYIYRRAKSIEQQG